MKKNVYLNATDRHSATWVGRKRMFGQDMRDKVLGSIFNKYLKSGKKILDLGCGDGIVFQHLLEMGTDVYAVDFSSEALKQTKKRGVKNISQFDFNIDPFPYKSNFFDVVTWNDNAEHLVEPGFALEEIRRVLKSDGKVIITVPNMGYWWYRLYYLIKGNVIGTDGIRPDGYINQPWEWEHIRFFNKYYLQKFLETYGFEIKDSSALNHNSSLQFFVPLAPQLFSQELLMVGEKMK